MPSPLSKAQNHGKQHLGGPRNGPEFSPPLLFLTLEGILRGNLYITLGTELQSKIISLYGVFPPPFTIYITGLGVLAASDILRGSKETTETA